MKQYHDLLNHIIQNGVEKTDRTGTGTLSIFGHQMRFNLNEGFPLITTKKVFMKGIIHELLWFLNGDTNVKYLQDNKVRIWDEWATEEQCARFDRKAGDLGPVYGHQWTNFGATEYHTFEINHHGESRRLSAGYNKNGINQIDRAIDLIKNNPDSRRIIITGWNPAECDKVALPPCHSIFQFYVADNKLSCQLYQRSGDVFLGVPFNIASYSLLTMMFAQVCGLGVGDFVHTFGDVHLYSNHIDQAKLQLSRNPRPLPIMELNPDIKDIYKFKYSDFNLKNYKPHPRIKAPVAV